MEIDRDMLQQVWVETNYQLDVWHVSKGRHMEHLKGMQKKKLGSFSSHP
jgi:hypothetical protein